HVLDRHAVSRDELTTLAGRVSLVDEVTLLIKLDVSLADDIAVLFPRRQIEGEWLKYRLLAVRTNTLVRDLHILERYVVARLEFRITAIRYLDILDYAAIDHLSIGRLDKAELVDACKARERRDKTDVWAFRRLDRADAAVVSRVDVTDLKSGTLA